MIKRFVLVMMLVCLPLPALADFAALVKKGDVHDRKFETRQALDFYLPAEKLNPNEAGLLVKIARQYVFLMSELPKNADKIQSGRTALRYAERAVALAPEASDPHLSVAICWGKLTPLLGNREKIEASRQIKSSADRAVRLDPRNDYAWHLLGRWHQSLANMGGATRVVARVIYGGLPAASNEEAVECFEKAIGINPKRLIHSIELGRTYAMMGRTADAKTWIGRGLAMPDREKDDPETKQRGRETLGRL